MQNTIDILSSINITVKEIAKSMAPQNGSGEAAMSKLSKGNVTTNADVNPAADVAKPNISKANIGDIISVLNTLSPTVLNIAKISRSQINRFTKVLDTIIKSVNKLSECAKNNKDSVSNVKIIIESFDILNDSVGKGSGLVIKAPIATLGLKLVNDTIKAIDAILKTVSKMSNVNDRIKKLNKITKVIDPLIKVVTKAALLVGLCMGLGALLMVGPTKDLIIGGLLVLGAVLLTTTTIILLTGLAGKLIKSIDAFAALKDIMSLTLASVLLVAACFGLGMAIEAMGGWEPLMNGLIVVGATMLMLSAIFWIIGEVGKVAISSETIKSYAGIFALTIASMILIVGAKYLGDYAAEHYESILIGLGYVVGTMLALVGIGWAAKKALSSSREAVISLAVLEGLALGAMVLVLAAKQLSDITKGYEVDILSAIGISMSIIVAFGALAALAGKLKSRIMSGVVAVASIELLAIGAIGITHLLINLHNVKEDAGINWLDLELDILGVISIVGTFGLLAAAFGFLIVPVLLGSIALVPVELLIVGAIGISHLLINLHNTITESGISFMDLEMDVLGMSMIMGTFGILASAMALLVIPIALGTPGMIAVAGFSLLVIGVIHSIINVSKAIEDAGGADKIAQTLSVGVPAILKNINSDNFSVDMGFLTITKMIAKYALLAELVTSILTVAESISKIAQIVGIVDESGRIRQILSIDKNTGEVKYGEPVDIKNLATVIAQTVKAFVENSQYSFKDVINMYNAREIFEILSTITEPISKFVDMLTGFTTGNDPNTLATVTIDEKGEVKIGEPVNIKDVAVVIAGAITSFVSELYKKENTENWAELIYGDRTFFERLLGKTNKRADSVREVAGVFGAIVEPICKFVDMISSLIPGKKGTLRKIFIDKDGKIKTGPEVDVKNTGNVIAELITSFITAVYKNSDQWKNITSVDGVSLDKLLKPLNDMVKSATEMSGEKIKSDLIRSNTDAIVYFNSKLVTSLLSIDTEIVNGKVAVIQSILNVAGGMSNLSSERILSNSKSIVSFMTEVVDKKMPKSKPTVDAFTKSIENLKKSFKDLDTILIKDEDKRTKALDEFEKRIKEIINTLKDGKPAMDSYNETLKNTQNYNTPNYTSTQPSYVQTPYATTQQNNTVNQNIKNNNNNVAFDPSGFATAFVEALQSKQIKFTPDDSSDSGAMPVKITTGFKIG